MTYIYMVKFISCLAHPKTRIEPEATAFITAYIDYTQRTPNPGARKQKKTRHTETDSR